MKVIIIINPKMYKPDEITPPQQSIFINYPTLAGNYYMPPVYVISS